MLYKTRKLSKKSSKKFWAVLAVVVVIVVALGVYMTKIPPFRALGGAIWLDSGVHYLNDKQITDRITQLNLPRETEFAQQIQASTPLCDNIEEGLCQQSPGDFVYKELVTPAVAYSPGTPDREEIIGYCTLCNDGTFSPSCATGRGACSWHGGVASWDVPEYRTIQGTAAVQAQPPVYSYSPSTYKASPGYRYPATPSLQMIVGY